MSCSWLGCRIWGNGPQNLLIQWMKPYFQFHLNLKYVNFSTIHMVSSLQQVWYQKYQPFNSYWVISGWDAEYEEMANKTSSFNEWNLIFNFIWIWSISISPQYTWLAPCNNSSMKNIHRSIVIELLVAGMQNMRKWPTKPVNSMNETLFSISFEFEVCQFLHNTHG